MKLDINDIKYLDQITRAVNSASGRIIMGYLEAELEKMSYDKIDITQSIDIIGQNYLAIKTARKKLSDIIKFLQRDQ